MTSLGFRFSACLACLGTALGAAPGCGGDDESSSRGGLGGGGAVDFGGSGGTGASTGGSRGGNGFADASVNCGNGRVDPGEECDPGADAPCRSDCRRSCGDGELETTESCDTGIPQGQPGACPTQCSSADPCVRSRLAGAGCSAACEMTTITEAIDGDSCCPVGATVQTDSDCGPVCGNGAVEGTEECDTAIASGDAGACVTLAACDDSNPCTVDVVAGDGTCTARCDSSRATAADPATADGCCPSGATPTTDADCDPLCGNGQIDGAEACDPAIPSGDPGACIQSCPDDGNACTTTQLVTANPCAPTCVDNRKTTTEDGDGCCDPALGAGSGTDTDCVPTAFRITRLSLAEPHLWTASSAPGDAGLGCDDQTEAINQGLIEANVSGDVAGADGGADGFYDLSFMLVFDPLTQVVDGLDLEFVQADCPVSSPAPDGGADAGAVEPCSRIPGTAEFAKYDNTPYDPTASNDTDPCLAPAADSLHPYDPPVTLPVVGTDGCFASRAADLSINLGPVTFDFIGAQIGATWVGDPADGMVRGLIMGFLTEAEVDQIVIPIGAGVPFGLLLPGATGASCDNPELDDRDTYGGQSGWWVYLEFEADRTPLLP